MNKMLYNYSVTSLRYILAIFFAAVFICNPAVAQKTKSQKGFSAADRPKNLTDSALLDLVQKQTFRYFWDFAHPVSGMARERSNTEEYGHDVVTTGGTGFGIMSVIVAVERGWIKRDTAARFMRKMVNFLLKANSYHGAFPHWLDGGTGKTIPFSRKDDGGDLVETSFLFQGLLCARQYFNQDNPVENEFRSKLSWMWTGIEWNWYTQNQEVLYWHWSPNNGWAMNFPVRGFNECLIMYVLAASDKDHYPVKPAVYHRGWAESNFFKNGRTFYGHTLPLGFDYGGPLFFSHYSFLGLDPRGLKDRYADYWQQNVNHTLINHDYCVDNPKKFKGYSDSCWGLTASDTYNGYNAHSPTNDFGTITPTAALSAFSYTPELSMKALKHFYYNLGDKIWGEYGFTDAFNETQNWYSKHYLAIDQGPIIVMIENYRSGLLWNLFMSCPEIKYGLNKLGFSSPHIEVSVKDRKPQLSEVEWKEVEVLSHPCYAVNESQIFNNADMKRIFSPHPWKLQGALAFVRIVTGLLMAYHGLEVFDEAKMAEYTKWESFSGYGSPATMVYIGKGAELISGLLLALGFFTRIAAIILIGTMLYISFKVGNGKFWYEDQHPFLFVLLGLVYMFAGGGKYSVDNLIFKTR